MGRRAPDDEMIAAWIAGVLSGIAGALGIGGGGVLIIYLTVFADVGQLQAQGINLLFFLPCGVVAVIIHAVKKRIKWATVMPCVIGGIIGVLAGTTVLSFIEPQWISKLFAAFLILLGIKSLFQRNHENKNQAHPHE